MKDMKQKMLILMVIFTESKLLNLIQLIDLNMEIVVILNMKVLNIEVLIVLFQLKFIVLSNVIIF